MSLVVISLDFEMRWGVHDIYGCNFDAYQENLHNLWRVIPRTLNLSAATWMCPRRKVCTTAGIVATKQSFFI